MDRTLTFRLYRTGFVDRPAEHVHDAAEGGFADRHRNRRAGIAHLHTAAQTVRGTERDRAHDAVTELLLDFERQLRAFHRQRVIDLRQLVAIELHVDHRTDALNDFALYLSHCYVLVEYAS